MKIDNKDLPFVVAKMLIEMQQMNNRIARPEDAMPEVRDEVRSSTDRLIDALTKNTAVMIERLISHDDQLKNHNGRLSQLKNPPR